MNLSKKKVYEALSRAERVFREPPEKKLNNELGLCCYLGVEGFTKKEIDYILKKKNASGDYMFGGSDKEIDYILEKENSDETYIFCEGRPQSMTWKTHYRLFNKRFERSNWCAKRKLDFVKIDRLNKLLYMVSERNYEVNWCEQWINTQKSINKMIDDKVRK